MRGGKNHHEIRWGKSSRLSEEKNILDFTRKKILLVLRGEKTPRKNEGKKLPRVFVT